MRFKLISCEVFFRELSLCAAQSPHVIDVEFTDKGAHDRSDYLRDLLQRKIDEADAAKKYDAILLGFGLCGNSVLHLQARSIPLVLPRAHDCCTLFLGSRMRFQRHFSENPSMPFSAAGYMERGDTYVHEDHFARMMSADRSLAEIMEKYGDENGRFIWETLHPESKAYDQNKMIYIEIPETSHLGHAQRCRQAAQAEGKEFILLNGDLRLLNQLVQADWPEDEFLLVPPGKRIAAVYDWDRIVQTAPGGDCMPS